MLNNVLICFTSYKIRYSILKTIFFNAIKGVAQPYMHIGAVAMHSVSDQSAVIF